MSDSSQIPPRGDFEKAERYINQLVSLINQNKIEVFHTDLKKFDPTTLHDHYSVSLSEYQIELSHSKQPNSGKDSFVMIFNNLKQLSEGSGEKVILAYVYLADSQFTKFKMVADRQIQERVKAEEEKKFKEALEPIDQLLNQAQGPVAPTPPHHQNAYTFGDKPQTTQKPQEDFDSSIIHQI